MKNQKMFLMVLISLLYVNTSWAEGFKVEKVNGEQTRAIIEVPADTLRTGDSLVMQDDFDVACYASVVSTKSRTAVLDISKCSNRSSVKPGVSFTVSATKRSNEKPLAQKEKPRRSGAFPDHVRQAALRQNLTPTPTSTWLDEKLARVFGVVAYLSAPKSE